MGRVDGKVAIVTGGASGMGKADALLLAAEGARVVVADLNEADGQAVAAAIGDNAIFLRLNVTDEDNWKSVIAATVEKFGQRVADEVAGGIAMSIGQRLNDQILGFLNQVFSIAHVNKAARYDVGPFDDLTRNLIEGQNHDHKPIARQQAAVT